MKFWRFNRPRPRLDHHGRPAQSPTAPIRWRAIFRQKYDRISDFSADFVHSYRGGVLKQQATERGRLLVKKPGKMRWEYTSPEKKTFVSDGHKLYSYIPQDKQVIVSTVPPQDQAPTPALFLTGQGNITRDFTVAFDKVAEAPAGSIALRLTPKKREAGVRLAHAGRAAGHAQPSNADHGRSAGRSIGVHFSNLKENVGLTDNQFVFKMPRNVDVVTDGGANRVRIRATKLRGVRAARAVDRLAGCASRTGRAAQGTPGGRSPGLRPCGGGISARPPAESGQRRRPDRLAARKDFAPRRTTTTRGRRLAAAGKSHDAVAEYQLAAEMNLRTRRDQRRAACDSESAADARCQPTATARPSLNRCRTHARSAGAGPGDA